MFVRATFCSPNLCFDVLLLYLLVFRVRQAGWGIRKMRWLPLILTVANLLFVFIYLLVFGSERQVGGNKQQLILTVGDQMFVRGRILFDPQTCSVTFYLPLGGSEDKGGPSRNAVTRSWRLEELWEVRFVFTHVCGPNGGTDPTLARWIGAHHLLGCSAFVAGRSESGLYGY